MGRRGPAPLPSQMLKLRQSKLANRNPHEPKPEPGLDPCPEFLGPEAKAMWNKLVPMLLAARMIAKTDTQALTRYCDAWERWLAAAKFINQHGEMFPIKHENGAVKCFQAWPQVTHYHRLSQTLTRLEQELGLTPSARSRITTVPGPLSRSNFFDPPPTPPSGYGLALVRPPPPPYPSPKPPKNARRSSAKAKPPPSPRDPDGPAEAS